jgi:hypothetical protein
MTFMIKNKTNVVLANVVDCNYWDHHHDNFCWQFRYFVHLDEHFHYYYDDVAIVRLIVVHQLEHDLYQQRSMNFPLKKLNFYIKAKFLSI